MAYLSQYFTSVAVKRLSAVEVDIAKSNQHEFNATSKMKLIFGDDTIRDIEAKFIWLGAENEAAAEEGLLTWYDSRRKGREKGNANRTEYRLYFKTNPIMNLVKVGDTLIVAKRPDHSIIIIIATSGSTIEGQISWLFDLPDESNTKFSVRAIEDNDKEIDFVVRYILEELGIEPEDSEADKLDHILSPFGLKFPNTSVFSELARYSIHDLDIQKQISNDDPDAAIMLWMDQEEKLFRRLERRIVQERLKTGFSSAEEPDVDGFINFSLQVQNRRKARAGYALQNHLETILINNKIVYSSGAITENKSKPDFLFPEVGKYKDLTFPETDLTMLGVKTTCKERWRQVLAEAKRIQNKHLLTLEPRISLPQTDEMRANNLQLVLPRVIHRTYKEEQQAWLLDLSSFLKMVKSKQVKYY